MRAGGRFPAPAAAGSAPPPGLLPSWPSLSWARLAFLQTRSGPPVPRLRGDHRAPPPVRVEFLTDDELLALIPGQPPWGLIKPPTGGSGWIFPHPGDEEKFITRL